MLFFVPILYFYVKVIDETVILLMYTFLLNNLDADYAHEWFVGEL